MDAVRGEVDRSEWSTASTPPPAVDLLPFLYTDVGNAHRLIAFKGVDLRFCHALKRWMFWDRKRWVIDYTDLSRKLAQDAMLEFLRQALEQKNETAQKFAKQ